jgi:hypothetical protein
VQFRFLACPCSLKKKIQRLIFWLPEVDLILHGKNAYQLFLSETRKIFEVIVECL